jgi:hypothetical protein
LRWVAQVRVVKAELENLRRILGVCFSSSLLFYQYSVNRCSPSSAKLVEKYYNILSCRDNGDRNTAIQHGWSWVFSSTPLSFLSFVTGRNSYWFHSAFETFSRA